MLRLRIPADHYRDVLSGKRLDIGGHQIRQHRRPRRPSARSCSRPKNAVRSDSDADRSDYHRPESDRGHVRSDWAILDDPTGAKLRICWEERGGPRVQPTDREGFVSRLIEASLEKAEAVLATEGASCVLEMTL